MRLRKLLTETFGRESVADETQTGGVARRARR